MALTSPQLTGLVLGILLPILLIALFTFLIHRYRNRTNPDQSSPKSNPDDPNSPPRFTLSADDEADPLRRGTVRRQTGQPQTFTEWIRASNLDEEGGRGKGGVMGRERWASLEYGPGPVIITQPSSAPDHVPSSPSPAPVAVDEELGSEQGKEDGDTKRTTRKGSMDESSLREAVLGVDGKKVESRRVDGQEKEMQDGAKIEAVKVNEEGQARKTRGYSGAWP